MTLRRDMLIGLAIVALVAWALGANLGVFADRRAVSPALADPAGAPIETHYSPAENLEPIDVALIDSAGETIDLDAYVLTDFPVIDALADAGERGVKVRIWRDPSEAGYTNPAELAKLSGAANVEIRVKTAGELMHLKSYCVDGQTLRTGAANLSASGLKRQDNDLIILRGPAPCARFEANFGKIWESGR